MNWYIMHVEPEHVEEVLLFFHKQKDLDAFMPMMEKWHTHQGVKKFIPTMMYPEYLFIKTNLSHEQFQQRYQDLLTSIQRFAHLLQMEDVMALTEEEQALFEQMFRSNDVIYHSTGDIINSDLVIKEGPLLGLEQKIKRIDRHKRLAFLDCDLLGKTMKVPLEVIRKS